MILVKIGRIGERVREYAFGEGTKLHEAINKAGVGLLADETFGHTMSDQLLLQTNLTEGARYIIQKKPQVTTMPLKIGYVGEVLRDLVLTRPTSLNVILSQEGIQIRDYEQVWLHRGTEVPVEVNMMFSNWKANDCIILEEKKPLGTVKRLIEEFDSEGIYEDEAVHQLAMRIIETVKRS